jgi:hypothetical protein
MTTKLPTNSISGALKRCQNWAYLTAPAVYNEVKKIVFNRKRSQLYLSAVATILILLFGLLGQVRANVTYQYIGNAFNSVVYWNDEFLPGNIVINVTFSKDIVPGYTGTVTFSDIADVSVNAPAGSFDFQTTPFLYPIDFFIKFINGQIVSWSIGGCYYTDTHNLSDPHSSGSCCYPDQSPDYYKDYSLLGYGMPVSGQIINNPGTWTKVPSKPKVYALSVGVRNILNGLSIHDYRFDLQASLVSDAINNFKNYGNNVAYNKVLTSQYCLTPTDIQTAFNEMMINPPQDGDNLIFYIAGHGENDSNGNTFVSLNNGLTLLNYNLNSSDLKILLSDSRLSKVNKWIIIDACHSGGFWDVLQSLPHIAILASATKDKVAKAISAQQAILMIDPTFPLSISGSDWYGIYSLRLLFALSTDNGYFIADTSKNGLTFPELSNFFNNLPSQIAGFSASELTFGDETIFDPTTDWNLYYSTSTDFYGAFPIIKKNDIVGLINLLLD